MWDPYERVVIDKIGEYINTGRWGEALGIAQSFRKALEARNDQKAKLAYVRWREAVALRLCGLTESAESAFQEAYDLAMIAEQPIIAAYVRADWSRLRSPAQAKDFLDEAIGSLHTAQLRGIQSPDPERRLDADRAYFEVLLADYLWLLDQRRDARQLVRGALVVLEADTCTMGGRYRQAYFLGLEVSIRMKDRPLRCACKGIVACIKWRRWDLPGTYLKGLRRRKSRR